MACNVLGFPRALPDRPHARGQNLHAPEYDMPHPTKRQRLIKASPLLLGLLLAVCLLGFSIFGLHKSYTASLQSTLQTNQALTDLLSRDVQRTFYAVSQIFIGMSALLDHHPFAPYDPTLHRALLSYVDSDPYLLDLLVVNDEATIIHWTHPDKPPAIRDRAYATVHLGPSPPGLYVGKPKRSKIHSGQWFFGISHAVRDAQGAVRYILVAIMDLTYFDDMFRKVGLHESASLMLLADTGEIYCRVPRHRLRPGDRIEGVQHIIAQLKDKPIAVSPVDGKKRLVAYREIADTGLITAITEQPHRIRSDWWRTNRYLLFFALLLVVAILGVSLLLHRNHNRLINTQSRLIRTGKAKDKLILRLKNALTEVKTLQGILPICASCKKIRDDQGYWGQVEEYLKKHTDAEFSHSLCPECVQKLYPGLLKAKNNETPER